MINVFIGYDSGKFASTGSNNVLIGYRSGFVQTLTGSNNILIGYRTQASSASVSNECTIGGDELTKFRIPNLNFVLNPTSLRTILLGDAAHSIHPLAGQGLNLSFRDCVSALNAIQNSLKFGNDLGDESILTFYKEKRVPKNIAMTAFTDLMFLGFTSTSSKTQAFLTRGMESLNNTNLKNIFRDLASI